jgi:peptidylprolyl isomerase
LERAGVEVRVLIPGTRDRKDRIGCNLVLAKVTAVIRLNDYSKGLALAAACVGLAACGSTKTADIPDGSGQAAASTTTATTTTETTAKAPTFAKPTAEVTKIANEVGTDTKKKPKIPKPSGKPPAKLTVVDIVKGTGGAATDGDTLTVDYAGTSWSTGKEFDASWNSGQPFPVTLGQGQVIQGWEQGLQGMKQGGRRLLVIPPDLGYGSSGSGAKIKPNETLIFVIDLRKKA